MKSPLVVWLLEVLAEDTALAQKVADRYIDAQGGPYWPLPSIAAGENRYDDLDIRAGFILISRLNPTVVLADLRAKTAIVEVLGWEREQQRVATDDMTIRVLATAYADRPGYVDDWWPVEYYPRPGIEGVKQ